MYNAIRDYLSYQGFKYVKPEKAGPLASDMEKLKALGQAARAEFTQIAKALSAKVGPFESERVSNWANQAQMARPHFWAYFRQPEANPAAVALAIRLYGDQEDWGISVEVSFVERHKDEQTLLKQAHVLDLPLEQPLYYFAQENGVSQPLVASETNRQLLQEQLASGQIRKVLVKYDIPVNQDMSLDDLTNVLSTAFDKLLPYYQACQ